MAGPDPQATTAPEARVNTAAWVAGAVVVGCLVALALGWFARAHQPSFEAPFTLGFSSQIAMKAWLAVVVTLLALVQIVSAFGIYGKLGSAASHRPIAVLHRVSGVAAVLVSLPIAFSCLWSLGYQDYTTRVMLHSVFGCLFYGAFVAKMLALRIKGLPGWVIPVFGGATFAILVGLLATSMAWWFTQGQPTY